MTYDAIPQLGIPLHHRDIEAILETMDEFIRTGRETGRCHQIVTINTDFLVQARRHEDVHAILRNADLAIPDGMPIVWASAALGQPLPGRVAGADLVPALAERAADKGYRLMFFGGSEGMAHAAAELLRSAHPRLIVEAASGMISATGETPPELLDEIRRFRPDVICVALGHPKQERWIRRYGSELSIPIAVGVGGTFDFIAGERKRATPWVQRMGLEWLFRLAQEPGRLTRRYANDIAVYIPSMLLQIGRTRVVGRPRRGGKAEGSPNELTVIRSDADVVVVALRKPGSLDHRTAAALASFATQTRRQGRVLRLEAPGPKATRSLEKLRLDRLVPLIPRRQDNGHDSTVSPPGR